jgi:hypothetical protein
MHIFSFAQGRTLASPWATPCTWSTTFNRRSLQDICGHGFISHPQTNSANKNLQNIMLPRLTWFAPLANAEGNRNRNAVCLQLFVCLSNVSRRLATPSGVTFLFRIPYALFRVGPESFEQTNEPGNPQFCFGVGPGLFT